VICGAGTRACSAETRLGTCAVAGGIRSGRVAIHLDLMRKVLAVVGSAMFLVIAPGFVAGVAPWWISHWRIEAPFFGLQLLRWVGALLVALGAIGLLDSFLRFALQGVGTPAPVFPTRHLVVTGLYRYVRNPMYLAVASTILGQGLVFGNVRLIEYGAIVWLLFHVFVLVYEEPTLRASFGAEYRAFCAEVPRWIPRFTPWRGHLEA
jgi:protein-S-isoprenylcysteine O-methyltransferase Ste14